MSALRANNEKTAGPVIQARRPRRLTIIDHAHVRQLIGFAKVMHEIGQAWSVKMRGMVGKQRPDELPEP